MCESVCVCVFLFVCVCVCESVCVCVRPPTDRLYCDGGDHQAGAHAGGAGLQLCRDGSLPRGEEGTRPGDVHQQSVAGITNREEGGNKR